jgi:serine/threonine protein kinase
MNPKNILLSEYNNSIKVKISDFEHSFNIPVTDKLKKLEKGTSIYNLQGWIPPEIVNSRQAGKPSDIYSLGYVFFYVVSNEEKLGRHRFGNSTSGWNDR